MCALSCRTPRLHKYSIRSVTLNASRMHGVPQGSLPAPRPMLSLRHIHNPGPTGGKCGGAEVEEDIDSKRGKRELGDYMVNL